MSDMQQPELNDSLLLVALERVLAEKESEWMLARAVEFEDKQTYLLRQRSGGETISLHLNALPSAEEAAKQFALSGNQFIAPKLSSSSTPVQFDPPIKAEAVVPGLAEESYLWKGYGKNTRGVIKLREGKVIAQVNAPSTEEAERYARHVVDVLRAA